MTWWQILAVLGGQALWTLFAVSAGSSIATRARLSMISEEQMKWRIPSDGER